GPPGDPSIGQEIADEEHGRPPSAPDRVAAVKAGNHQERDWERWDGEGVAATIESYWQGSAHEHAHRDTLAELCALYLTDPGLDVLEVGCGTGMIYQRLVPRLIANERYTGVDVSEEMLAIGRRKFPRARLLAGDGYALRFADRSFDTVLCFEVLGHLPEIGTLLREMVRVARKTVIFTIWPAADGVVETRESVRGERFLHRQYSHAYLYEQIQRALPDVAIEMEVGILHAEHWAYVLHRREGPGGLAFTRLFPVPGYQRRLAEASQR
ncbi:MAG TPA: methyltransferase domain-containing protein, partial [Thermoanaerobaculia bacterium]|nr:methyltransferase domain-containing protein [Thermoanaerobaculia bacterium]